MEYRSPYKLVAWILLVILMVYAMVVLGGLTRLTNSGLSMVDWRPIMGTLPPITESDWNKFSNNTVGFLSIRRSIKECLWMNSKGSFIGRP